MSNALPKRAIRERAEQMRRLTDDERDGLIAASGRKVIDCRSRFADMQRQSALAEADRAPRKPGGVA